MSNLARRHPKELSTSHHGNNSGYGNGVSNKDKNPNDNSNKKKIAMSFVSGALTMGILLVFLGRDINGCLWPHQQRESSSSSSTDDAAMEQTSSPSPGSQSTTRNTQAGGQQTKKADMSQWTFYEGDVNQYYNELEKDIQRNPKDINNYAVHRWMGTDHSTKHHYELIYESIIKHTAGANRPNKMADLRLLDAGCGLGAAMTWFETKQPTWKIVGRTLSVEQEKFIKQKLPYDSKNFKVELRSYDDLDEGSVYDVIYSIEAMIHSTDIHKTMSAWAKHLDPTYGSLIIIDDFLMPGFIKNSDEMQGFIKGWMANSFYSITELNKIGRKYGIELVESRDVLEEFRVVELNYRNKKPSLSPDGAKVHQGWIGSKLRHKLTVEGQIGYSMLVFRRIGAKKSQLDNLIMQKQSPTAGLLKTTGQKLLRATKEDLSSVCASVPLVGDDSNRGDRAEFDVIRPKEECISSWYCCGKHNAYLNKLATKRTHTHGFLKMDPSWFGNYMSAFSKHLNKFYETIPSDYKTGRFLDIGATGSTASGMKQVTTKFQHFAGPLQYWMLDSDKGAQSLNRTIYCDITSCPEAESCNYDVTFSHTVLEHASHPDKAFDEIARLTKKGGLTMHLVPWSYQWHATPDDYYRFSHSALRVLMEDRGFEPLEIGYDLCSKPEKVMERVDEHYDFIWLTYVIAKKKS